MRKSEIRNVCEEYACTVVKERNILHKTKNMYTCACMRE